MSRLVFAAVVGACSALVLGASAFAAGPKDQDLVVRIKVTSADLQSHAGSRKLAFHIRRAADHVCGANEDRMVRESEAFWRCREAAIDHATRDLRMLAAAPDRSPQVLAHADH
ncbi:MAG TPA: UrcA family protein [Caulobacteraceae bacterium]|jgi:UrcA family protein